MTSMFVIADGLQVASRFASVEKTVTRVHRNPGIRNSASRNRLTTLRTERPSSKAMLSSRGCRSLECTWALRVPGVYVHVHY